MESLVRLKNIHIQGYKCLKNVDLNFQSGLTILIGRNGTGKSALLDVFDFIREGSINLDTAVKSRGTQLVDLIWGKVPGGNACLDFIFEVPDNVRNQLLSTIHHDITQLNPNAPNVIRSASRSATFPSLASLLSSPLFKEIQYSLSFGTNYSESLMATTGQGTFATVVAKSKGRNGIELKGISVDDFASYIASTNGTVLNVLSNLPSKQGNHADFLFKHSSVLIHASLNELIQKFFSNAYKCEANRNAVNSLPVDNNAKISSDGANLVQILAKLNNSGGTKILKSIEEALKSLVPSIQGIRPDLLPDNKFTAVATENLLQIGEVAFSINELSTGTQQMIILLTQLLTQPPNSLLLLEEIEAMLHPKAQETLYSILKTLSSDKTIIIATHSPIIASQAQLEALYLFKKEDGASKVSIVTSDLINDVISELGIKPSHNWEKDFILFVEGDYDKAAYETLLLKNATFPHQQLEIISTEGYGNAVFFANAKLLEIKVCKVNGYVLFDGDVKKKPKYQTLKSHLSTAFVRELSFDNLEALILSQPSAVAAAFPSISEEDIKNLMTVSSTESLKSILGKLLRYEGGYNADSVRKIAVHLSPPKEIEEIANDILAKVNAK